LEGLAPGLAPGWDRGLLMREDWRIEATTTLAALRRAASEAGVEFRHVAATGFEGGERLVIATGAGQDLGVVAPELANLSPIKGHILRTRERDYRGVVVRGPGAYVTGAPGGLTIGATMEAGVGDRVVEASRVGPLRAAGVRLFPDLAGAAFEAETGVRGATPDGLPMVGRGRHQDVLLAVGARRNGWLLAPLIARLIVACVTEGEAGPFAEAMSPARFDASAK
jgi:glycine oxidase